MAKTLSLVGGLPDDLMHKLIALRDEGQQILAHQKRLVPFIHREVRVVNGKAQETLTERMQPKVKDPRLSVQVQMSEDKTVRVVLTLVRRDDDVQPHILALDASEYAVLSEHINARGVSWESFFEQVVG